MKEISRKIPLVSGVCASVALSAVLACGGGYAFLDKAWAEDVSSALPVDSATSSGSNVASGSDAATGASTSSKDTSTDKAASSTDSSVSNTNAADSQMPDAAAPDAPANPPAPSNPVSVDLSSTDPAQPVYDGLTLIDGKLSNYSQGSLKNISGWRYFQNTWYYFKNSSHALENAWVEDYYLGKDGKMLTSATVDWKSVKYRVDASGKCIYGYGWHKDAGHWFFTNSNGTLKTNWIWVKGSWYLLDTTTGQMATYWAKAPDNNWYHFYSWGGMCNPGWQWINNQWYYMNSSGAMRTGWLYQSGTWYLLTPSGAMATGWEKGPDNRSYHFKSWGGMDASTWIKTNNEWYYVGASGAMQTGWLSYKGYQYYLDPTSGKMLHDTITQINKKRYAFASNGTLAKSTWITDPATSSKVWVDSTGSISDAVHISKDGIYTDKNGNKLSGLTKVGSDVVYIDPKTGKAKTGWQTVDGTKYYFDPSTGFAHKGWLYLNNTWYYGQMNSGKILTGWQWIGNYWYYFREDGSMTTHWQWINNDWYYLRDDGSMTTGWQWIGNKWWWMKSNGALADKPAITGTDYIDSYMYGMAHDLGSLRAGFDWVKSHTHTNWRPIWEARYSNGTTYWMSTEVERMLYGGPADCYAFAATFAAYAKAMGYNVNLVCGFVPSASAGWASHSWVEINQNGQTYVYDTDLARSYRGINWFGFTYANAPTNYRKG